MKFNIWAQIMAYFQQGPKLSKEEKMVNLRWCKNRVCALYKVIVDTPSKKCSNCSFKTKAYNPETDDIPADDTPVLFVGSTSPSQLPAPTAVHMPPANRLLSDGGNKVGVFSANPKGKGGCDLRGCPIAAANPDIVKMPYTLYQQFVFLAHKVPVEWIAYIKGKQEGNIYLLDEDGVIFPMQKATGAHVQAEHNSASEEGIIAAIHSHVKMPTDWSSEDEEHWGHPVELVINSKGHLNAVTRVKLKCGEHERTKPTVKLIYNQAQDNFEKQLLEKLVYDEAHDRRYQTDSATYNDNSRPRAYCYDCGHFVNAYFDKAGVPRCGECGQAHVQLPKSATKGKLVVLDKRFIATTSTGELSAEERLERMKEDFRSQMDKQQDPPLD